jgi:hypothetical protein
MSSPSHEPVSLPLSGPIGLKKRETRKGLRRANIIATIALVSTRAAGKPPPRVESTQPPETSLKATDSEDTPGKETAGEEPRYTLPQGGLLAQRHQWRGDCY